jgi:hypothetical protein
MKIAASWEAWTWTVHCIRAYDNLTMSITKLVLIAALLPFVTASCDSTTSAGVDAPSSDGTTSSDSGTSGDSGSPDAATTGAEPLFVGASVASFNSCQTSCGQPSCPNGTGCTDVIDPTGSGEMVIRLRSVEGDASGSVVRAQTVTSAMLSINGGEYWDVVGVYFPANFPTVSAWQAVYSFYGTPYAGSPGNIQAVHGNDIDFNYSLGNDRIWSRPLVKGTWLNFARHYKLSNNSSVGWMEIYYSTGDDPLELQTLANGETRWQGATITPGVHDGGPNDFRISNYRAQGMSGFGDQSIYYRRVSIWPGSANLADIATLAP